MTRAWAVPQLKRRAWKAPAGIWFGNCRLRHRRTCLRVLQVCPLQCDSVFRPRSAVSTDFPSILCSKLPSSNLPLSSPAPTSAAATKKMRGNRRADTKPELHLRSLLHKAGLRFRKDYPIQLPGGQTVRPDIVFTRKRVAVFIDGCFWHSCPQHGTVPKSNQDYWVPKLQQNIQRDHVTTTSLTASGWHVIRVWEHSVPEEALATIKTYFALAESTAASGS